VPANIDGVVRGPPGENRLSASTRWNVSLNLNGPTQSTIANLTFSRSGVIL
jgi:hypothetical protein